ncbi:MAG: hypothetical protein Q7S40_01950 [Opitutaceae bacterium]|nr:hypothetical protein [Opitutaceae bacterium]
MEGADFTPACSAGSTDLSALVAEIASRAANSIRGTSGLTSRDIDIGHRE